MTKPSDTDKLHRLEDILVEEVSAVDRAANKRKFLVIKRGQTMKTGPEVVQGADGNLITATIKMRPQWKEGIMEAAADALERLAGLVETTKAATESDDDSIEFPTEISGELSAIADAIGGIAKKLGVSKAAPDVDPDAGGNGGNPDSDPEPSDVAKGHWMTALQGMFDDLRKVIDEAKQAQPKATDVPNVGSGTQPDKEAAVPGEKFFADAFAGLTKSIKGLEESFDQVQTTVHKQAEKINDLESAVDSQSSRTPEAPIQKADDDEVTWPMDMAGKKRDF
jgi:archaellum component FlaC